MKNIHKNILRATWFLWLVLLIWLSSENGEATSQTSRQLTEFIINLLHLPSENIHSLDNFLRTAAHFAGFFVLSGLGSITLYVSLSDLKKAIWLTGIICGIIAVLDEAKKLFIDGRHMDLPEVGLNILGVICGILATSLLVKIMRGLRKTKVVFFK